MQQPKQAGTAFEAAEGAFSPAPAAGEDELRAAVLGELKSQGFSLAGGKGLCAVPGKDACRKLHEKSRAEQLARHRDLIRAGSKLVVPHIRSACEINPLKIDLELRRVSEGTPEHLFFRWWNLVWWSIPYQRPYGRQMRYLLWDRCHDAPFGLIQLMSPTMHMAARDRYLGITYENRDLVLNQSLLAQRVGALPPYNQLLGGKMVALALTADEVRDDYRAKYGDAVTVIKKRTLPAELLFIVTTSAFGRSSIYNRLVYRGEKAAVSLGFTAGSGTFHISDSLYARLLEYLESKGVDTTRGYGSGPSRKMKLVSTALRLLGIRRLHYHNVQREVILFPLVRNLHGVLHGGEPPDYIKRPFAEVAAWWKERYCVPRFERVKPSFDAGEFLENLRRGGLV